MQERAQLLAYDELEHARRREALKNLSGRDALTAETVLQLLYLAE